MICEPSVYDATYVAFFDTLFSLFDRKSEKKKAKEMIAAEQAVVDSELWEARYEALTETKNDFRYSASS